MGGYQEFPGHPWHHYLAGGPFSLIDLMVLPLGLLFLLAVCSAGRRVENLLGKHRSSAGPGHGEVQSNQAVQPALASDVERGSARLARGW
jgi:hypothetical protein